MAVKPPATTPTPPRIGLPTRGAARSGGVSSGSTPFSGAATLSVPLPAFEARSAPDLALSYSHQAPNGPFGLGVTLDLPFFSRRARRGIPRYADDDVFLGPDGGPLAPGVRQDAQGRWVPEAWTQSEAGVAYDVRVYRPRVDAPDRVERWRAPDGSFFWKVRDASNGVRVFGRSAQARVADPDAPRRVYQWLLEEEVDAHGNRIRVDYRQEDGAGWSGWRSASGFAARYVASVQYGNHDAGSGEVFAFELRFDYGDLDPATGAPVRPWPVRADPVTTCRPGFPLLQLRLCRRVLLLNHLPDVPGPAVARVLELTYDENPRQTLLVGVRVTGQRVEGGEVLSESLPPMTLAYETADPDTTAWQEMGTADGSALPGVLERGGWLLADLHGDGLPGVVWSGAGSFLYAAPLGDGRLGAPQPLPAFPDVGPLAPERCTLQDITGEGTLSLVLHAPGLGGSFANRSGGAWGPFRPFAMHAPEAASPAATLADFNGAGLADALVQTPAGLRLYPSRGADGFAPPVEAPAPSGFPILETIDPLVSFADVLGDGLPHCVRVSSGRVEVWCDLGNGRFAPPFLMRGAPAVLDAELRNGRVLLADFCGSGRADLLVVRADAVDVHPNQGGFAFGPAFRVPVPGGVGRMDTVTLADVLGNGHACLVVSSAGAPARTRFLDPFRERHPDLLALFRNGTGGEIRYRYRSSASYALEDAAAGQPWTTRLPVPVVVVSRVERRDLTTGLVAAETYRYRDGWLDPLERAFEGFGFVEVLTEPSVEGSAGPSQPRLTRSWYRIGDEAADASRAPAFFLGGAPEVGPDRLSPLAQTLGPETAREARLALAGHLVREETYALDATGAPTAVPLRVEAQAYDVELIQPAAEGVYGSFSVRLRERIESAYEGVSDDPRVVQEVVLDWDAAGLPGLGATVTYARRTPRLPAQAQTRVVVWEEARILLREPSVFLTDLRWQTREWELSGLAPAGAAFTWEELEAQSAQALDHPVPYGTPFPAEGLTSRLYAWEQAFFWDAQRTQALPPGQATPQALVHHDREAVFPMEYPQAVYGQRVDDAMLRDAGYEANAGHWWRRGDVVRYAGPEAFHLPVSFQGPFQEGSACTRVAYDAALLQAIRVTDALGRETRMEIDPQSREPARVTDENGVVTEALYDALGRMVVTTRHAATSEGWRGGMALASYRRLPAPTLQQVLDDPDAYLQGALAYHLPLAPPASPGDPACSVVLSARAYVDAPDARAPRLPPGVALLRSDGFGLPLEMVERVEAEAAGGASGDPSWTWRTLGRLVHDGEENVGRRYVPAFVEDPGWTPRLERPFALLTHDALGREVQELDPKGFLTRTGFPDAWTVRHLDEDDTVTESPYYRAHIDDPALPPAQRRALEEAARFADTPTSTLLDPQGHEIAIETIDVEGPDGSRVTALTTYTLDVRGLALAKADPRLGPEGKQNVRQTFDMLGRTLHAWRADAGDAWFLPDASDAPCQRWSARGDQVRTVYEDPLHRPVREEVRQGNAWAVALALAYGSDPGALDVGRPVQVRDQSGVTLIASYDLSGLPAQATRRFVRQEAGLVDWSDPSAVALFDESWPQSWERDPAGGVMVERCAEGSTLAYERFANGWLRALRVGTAQGEVWAIQGLRYAPWGAAEGAEYGAAASLSWTHDPLSRELVRARAVRPRDGARLQDLSYVPDPVGNLTSVEDAAPAFGEASYRKEFTFDALYRLVRATGMEAGPAGAPVGYVETYAYDPAGNLRHVHRAAGTTESDRTFDVAPDSDRAVPEAMAGGGVDACFDAAGNLLRLEDGTALSYDYQNRLSVVQPAEGPAASFRYGADGLRDRMSHPTPGGGSADTFVVGRARLLLRREGTGGMTRTAALWIRGVERDLLLVEDAGEGGGLQVRHILSDRVGSVTRELDAQGTVVRAADYRPYGETSLESGAPLDPPAPQLAFSGKERDAGTGLSYFGGRHYVAAWGRWLTPDPAGEIDGLNLYAYVGDNPVTRVDPTGFGRTPRRKPKNDRKPRTVPMKKRHYAVARYEAATATAVYIFSKEALKEKLVVNSDKRLYLYIKHQLRQKYAMANEGLRLGLRAYTSVLRKVRTASQQWVAWAYPSHLGPLPRNPSGTIALRPALAKMAPPLLPPFKKDGTPRHPDARKVETPHPELEKLLRQDVDEFIARNQGGPTLLQNAIIVNQGPLNAFANSLAGAHDRLLTLSVHGGGPRLPIGRYVIQFVEKFP